MLIYDSVERKRLLFEPLQPNIVTIYVCGPTVYDDAHLGHARSAVAFDLLRRVFKAKGYHVIFVKNFTDIDDKIIAKMKESGKSLEEITTFYIARYKEEMNALHVDDADIEPKATECVSEIIGFIETLLAKDIGYTAEDGIYFDTSKDSKYLSLSGRLSDDESSLARVEQKESKRDQKDFALWKFSKETSEPSYGAPFGQGRPGWHIECSAMIEKYLAQHEGAYQIDIHAGGADLLFPHHENEAAQTRCKGHQELAKYWMHNGFVTINGQKMSKSLGNSFFLKDALNHYDGEVLRFYLLSTHYRAHFNFSEEDLQNSKKRLDKLYRLKKRLEGIETDAIVEKTFKQEMLDALEDDLNISKALAILDAMITSGNELLDKNPKDTLLKNTLKANLAWINLLLGIGFHSSLSYFQMGVDEQQKERIESRIKQRSEAKKNKDFATADALRKELEAESIQLLDTASGTQWEKVN